MDSGPVGRNAEIAEIRAFLCAASGEPAAVAVTGDAGIGKTAVWQHLLQAASRSSTVLSCRPAPAERPLAFSALDDLFGDVAEQVLPELPGPRRRAVELALLRDASIGIRPEPRGLARGMLDVLRVLSAEAPVIVAVDDARWLDRPSAGVLEFCFRRLRWEPVTVLLTFRDDSGGGFPLGLDLALPADRLGRVRLGPVSVAAIGEIIRSRLGTVLPGPYSGGCMRRAAGTPSTLSNMRVPSLGTRRCPSPTSPSPFPTVSAISCAGTCVS